MKKLHKKLLTAALLVVASLLVLSTPNHASAVGDDYLYIHANGDVTYQNNETYDQDVENNGFNWNESQKTLTLDSYNYLPIKIEERDETVKIVLNGENTIRDYIELGRDKPRPSILSDAPLEVSGQGSIELSSGTTKNFYDLGILTNEFKIKSGTIVGSIRATDKFEMEDGTVNGFVESKQGVIDGGSITGDHLSITEDESSTLIVNGGTINVGGLIAQNEAIINGGTVNAVIAFSKDEPIGNLILGERGTFNAQRARPAKVEVNGGTLNVSDEVYDAIKEEMIDLLIPNFYDDEQDIENNFGYEKCAFEVSRFELNTGEVNTCLLTTMVSVVNDGSLNVGGNLQAIIYNQYNGDVKIKYPEDTEPSASGLEKIGLITYYALVKGGTLDISAPDIAVYIETDGGEWLMPEHRAEINQNLAPIREMFGDFELPDEGLIKIESGDVTLESALLPPILASFYVNGEGYASQEGFINNEEWVLKLGEDIVAIEPEEEIEQKVSINHNEAYDTYAITGFYGYKGVDPYIDLDRVIIENAPLKLHFAKLSVPDTDGDSEEAETAEDDIKASETGFKPAEKSSDISSASSSISADLIVIALLSFACLTLYHSTKCQ